MEADGCRCAPGSSKPVIVADNCLGGFDSHTLPPKITVVFGRRNRGCMNHKFSLNSMTCKGGCGAKIEPGILNRILSELPKQSSGVKENLLVGFENGDDACVYRISDDCAIIETVDFFPPIVDDPYLFGAIAATNALSDVYAMGGTPIMALNLLTFPCSLPEEAVTLILKGGSDVADAAGVAIGGGHSIDDKEPKYGLCVTGTVHPDRIWRNSTACPGDVLILTKKLGVGIYAVSSRGNILSDEDERVMLDSMLRLNKVASETAREFKVHACTDVTGFGLVGHSLEMARGSGTELRFDTSKLPILPKAIELASMGMVPTGAYQNRKLVTDDNVVFSKSLETAFCDVCFDPQTSGGLLLSMPRDDAEKYIEKMLSINEEVYLVGEVGEGIPGRIVFD